MRKAWQKKGETCANSGTVNEFKNIFYGYISSSGKPGSDVTKKFNMADASGHY